jgi:hypothetical protein
MPRGIIGAIVAIVVIVIIAAGSWYTVDQSNCLHYAWQSYGYRLW